MEKTIKLTDEDERVLARAAELLLQVDGPERDDAMYLSGRIDGLRGRLPAE